MSPKTPLKALAYTAIDLEATGLDPTRDRPVALGAVRLVGGRLGAELELLLDPGRPVGREAQALHGLSREALKGKPTLKEALPPFLAFLQGTVLLAHQAHVDLAFLPALKRFPLLDTYLLARFLLPLPGADPRLEALAERFGIPLLRRHTALGDARLVAEVFRHLLPLLEGAGVRTLEAGEFFGFPSLLSGEPPALSVVAKTPVKVLSFPQEAFQRLLMYPEVARFFGQGLVQRVQLRRVPEPSLFAPVGSLVRRPPALIPASATVEEAARRMREEGISSLLVEASPLGILTDRDLRNRVLAEGRPPITPVAEVMTAPLFTLPVETPIYEALAAMVERGIHHLPLTEGEKVVGVVTHTDILLNQAQSPLLLLRRIERLELERYSPEVASLVESLFHRGLGGVEIGRVVASLNDALIRRLVKEAEAALGPPPVVYAFMVFGSEGRREQALLTDQDNALAVAEEGHEAYFQTLAEHVVGGLIRAGIPECKGGYMATRWRKTLPEWQETFRRWMEAPEPQALLETQIFFDLRKAAGSLSLKPLEETILEGSRKGVFLYHLAQASQEFRPPLGLFGRVRTEEGFVDLKRHALAPIVALARLYALMAGSLAKGTVERLKAAAEGGTLSQEGAERLEEAFRFFFALRLKHQLAALRQGKGVDNRVLWSALGTTEKRRALEGFRAIAELQESTARSFQLR